MDKNQFNKPQNEFDASKQKFEGVTDLPGAMIEKNKIVGEIKAIKDDFEMLVRQKINLDAPRQKITAEISDLKRSLDELNLRSSNALLHSPAEEKGLLIKIKQTLQSIISRGSKSEMINSGEDTQAQISELEKQIELLNDELTKLNIQESAIDMNLDPVDKQRTGLIVDKTILEEKAQKKIDDKNLLN